MPRRRSAAALLAKVDKVFGAGLPTPSRRRESPEVQAAAAEWDAGHAALIREGATVLQDRETPITDAVIREQVRRGLWIAWARYLAAPDARGAYHAATAFGIFFDKYRLLSGQPTQIMEERRWERIEVLAKIQAVLVARGQTSAPGPPPEQETALARPMP